MDLSHASGMRGRVAPVLIVVLALAGCKFPIPKPTKDISPPTLAFGSDRTAPSVIAGAEGQWTATSAIAGQDPFFTVQAQDHESGVRNLSIRAQVRVWCIDDPTADAPQRRNESFVSEVSAGSRDAGSSAPKTMFQLLEVPMARIQSACAGGTSARQVEDFQIDAVAEATNGAGRTTTSGEIGVVRGPVSLKITVQNICVWCRAGIAEDALDREIEAAARYWATRDIVLLCELDDPTLRSRLVQRTEAIRGATVHVAHEGTNSILSRWPLVAQRRIWHESVELIPNTDFLPGLIPFWARPLSSEALRAVALAEDRPIEIYSLYWAHQPGPRPWGSIQPLSVSRLLAADSMLAMADAYDRLQDRRTPVFLGGDTNSAYKPGASPTMLNGELVRMTRGFSVALDQLPIAENAGPAFFRRFDAGSHWIDLLFLRGPWRAVAYSDDSRYGDDTITPPTLRSDHPMQQYDLVRVKD